MSIGAVKDAYYIKLGSGGEWEEDCLRDRILRLDYRETPHEACLAGDWDAVKQFWMSRRRDVGAASRDAQQIRIFYEADEHSVFITFHRGLMHWCRPAGQVTLLDDGSRYRSTVTGWNSRNAGDKILSVDRLSGGLLKVQGFRGTICKVKAADYLIRKLNDDPLPEVAAAEEAANAHRKALIGLMRLLTWRDFELLVELVFSTSGWRRVSEVGRTQKTVDLELILPTTAERAFVQVKSEATSGTVRGYRGELDGSVYDRMFFVWHTGMVENENPDKSVSLIGPEKLATMVLDAGLGSWLIEKVS